MPEARQRRARRIELGVRLHELPLIIGLVALWMMLWGEMSPLSFVSGVLVAILVMRLFYLPPVELGGRFHPGYAIAYLSYFLWHIALASWQVAWLAVRPGPPPPVAIIEVRLRTRSDFILTLVGLTISLIPGSLVADVDRFQSVLYLHVLNTPTQREIRVMRREVLRIERLLTKTFGEADQIGGQTR